MMKSTTLFKMAGLCILLLTATTAPAAQFDYSSYNNLLSKYVADGLVDYRQWLHNDFTVFAGYIAKLATASAGNGATNEQKAFWINAYNALTIYSVLKNIPDNDNALKFSVKKVSGFFNKNSYRVAGEMLTLDDIENKLRTIFHDPRIHFAIVCASRSCPVIQNKAYAAATIDKELQEAAFRFIQDTTRNHLIPGENIFYLSKIFWWYQDDFQRTAGSVLDYVKKYLPPDTALYISNHTIKIKHLDYDWLVNIKR